MKVEIFAMLLDATFWVIYHHCAWSASGKEKPMLFRGRPHLKSSTLFVAIVGLETR